MTGGVSFKSNQPQRTDIKHCDGVAILSYMFGAELEENLHRIFLSSTSQSDKALLFVSLR